MLIKRTLAHGWKYSIAKIDFISLSKLLVALCWFLFSLLNGQKHEYCQNLFLNKDELLAVQDVQQTAFQKRIQIILVLLRIFPSSVSLDWQNISQDSTGIAGDI